MAETQILSSSLFSPGIATGPNLRSQGLTYIFRPERHRNTAGVKISRTGLLTRESSVACQSQSSDAEVLNIGEWRRSQLVRIAKFTLPALAIPLADPVMSLVDTICIGQYAGTLELASLGPTTLIFNFVNYVFNALSIATVSVVGEKLRRQDEVGSAKAISTSLAVAGVSGLVVFSVLQGFAVQLVTLTGCAPELISPAVSYLRIRAFACPAVTMLMVSQASMLAMKDSVSPCVCVLLQSSINLVGDLLLIAVFHTGICGAATATALSQYVGVASLLLALRQRGKIINILKLPFQEELRSLVATVGPMSVVYLCKNICYSLLQGAATGLQTMVVAAHQPVWVLVNLCAFCHTPLEQACLAFLPATKNTKEEKQMVALLVGCGLAVGLSTAIIGSGIPLFFPFWFSKDALLWPIMQSVSCQAFFALILCGVDVSSTGVLVAKRDLFFVARAMATSMAGLTAYLAVHKSMNWGLQGMWWGFVFFFALRSVQSVSRLLYHFGPKPLVNKLAA